MVVAVILEVQAIMLLKPPLLSPPLLPVPSIDLLISMSMVLVQLLC